MQFEEDESRVADEDPEFTDTAAVAADDLDDEFLSDDIPLPLEEEEDDEDDENSDLAADL